MEIIDTQLISFNRLEEENKGDQLHHDNKRDHGNNKREKHAIKLLLLQN